MDPPKIYPRREGLSTPVFRNAGIPKIAKPKISAPIYTIVKNKVPETLNKTSKDSKTIANNKHRCIDKTSGVNIKGGNKPKLANPIELHKEQKGANRKLNVVTKLKEEKLMAESSMMVNIPETVIV